MTKIKFCGLTRPADIQYANVLRPDYVGFVLTRSRRQISTETARAFRLELDLAIEAVGVFAGEEADLMLYYAEMDIIQAIQLHAGPGDHRSVSEDLITYLKERTPVPVIKAVSFGNASDETCGFMDTAADYLLLDHGPGGSGQVFDWDQISERPAKPFFLAGGIGPDNARAAEARFHPYCLDCSSSLETEGYKDFEKMKQMLEVIRNK